MVLAGLKDAKELVSGFERTAKTLLITHDDADGLTAGSIAFKAFIREGFTPHLRCKKRLEKDFIKEISKDSPDLCVFSDTGSGQLEYIIDSLLEKSSVIVLDHHETVELSHKNLVHINPHIDGIDGAREISGAGVAYMFARTLSSGNKDLAHLAIIGALGDVQDSDGSFIGLNQEISQDAVESGNMHIEQDLRLFGRQTRPLHKAIEYTTEPFIPGLSGNESACVQFLSDLGIPAKKNGEYTTLSSLDEDARQKLTTALILKMIEHKVDVKAAERILGDVYTLVLEEEKTILRDAKEYTSLLNACGRYEKYGIGIGICLGDRGSIYQGALTLLEEHKKYISNCYEWIDKNFEKVKDRGHTYSFDAGDELSENVIGTVVSMVLNSRLLQPLKPVIGFAEADDLVKISGRATKELVEKGVNLGLAMKVAAKKTGGEGGGHDIAAGAQVSPGKEEEFASAVNEEVGKQLS